MLNCWAAAPSGRVAAQAMASEAGGVSPLRRPNPGVAAGLSIVPGLGHFYLGHKLKGVAYLVGVGGLQFFGFDLDLSVIGAAIGVPMELGGAGLWLFSIVDAYRTAKQTEAPPRT